jgi:hypothetical protein
MVGVAASRDTCSTAGDLVTPGRPDQSYLVAKILGVGMCPGTDRMPRIGTPLGDTETQTIVDWICAGAKND